MNSFLCISDHPAQLGSLPRLKGALGPIPAPSVLPSGQNFSESTAEKSGVAQRGFFGATFTSQIIRELRIGSPSSRFVRKSAQVLNPTKRPHIMPSSGEGSRLSVKVVYQIVG